MVPLARGEERNDYETKMITVSSYNVLIDSVHPPARDRNLLVVKNILADSAMADILVLQEVCDDFLSFMLNEPEVQEKYAFVSHGPPNQPEIGPLHQFTKYCYSQPVRIRLEFGPFPTQA